MRMIPALLTSALLAIAGCQLLQSQQATTPARAPVDSLPAPTAQGFLSPPLSTHPARYRTIEEVIDSLGGHRVRLDSVGDFIIPQPGPQHTRSVASSPRGRFVLECSDQRGVLRTGKEQYDLQNVIVFPDGDTLYTYGLVADGPLYQFTCGGTPYSLFQASNQPCNGSFCLFSTFFLVNHAAHKLATFQVYQGLPCNQPIADVDADGQPEFMMLDFDTSGPTQLPYSDTLETLRIRPYTLTRSGSYQPLITSSGDTLVYEYLADFRNYWDTNPSPDRILKRK